MVCDVGAAVRKVLDLCGHARSEYALAACARRGLTPGEWEDLGVCARARRRGFINELRAAVRYIASGWWVLVPRDVYMVAQYIAARYGPRPPSEIQRILEADPEARRLLASNVGPGQVARIIRARRNAQA